MSLIRRGILHHPWLLDDGTFRCLLPILPSLLEELGVAGIAVQIWLGFIITFKTAGQLAGETVLGWRQQNRYWPGLALLSGLAEACIVMCFARITSAWQLLCLGMTLGLLSSSSSSGRRGQDDASTKPVGISLPMMVGYSYDSVRPVFPERATLPCGVVAIFGLWTSLCRQGAEQEEGMTRADRSQSGQVADTSARQQASAEPARQSWEEIGLYGVALSWSSLVPIVAGGGFHGRRPINQATSIGKAIAWKTQVATLFAPRVFQALTARLDEHDILDYALKSGLLMLWTLQLWWEKFTRDDDVAKRNAFSYIVLTFAPVVFHCLQNALPTSQTTTPTATPAVGKVARSAIRILVPFTVLLCHAMDQTVDEAGGFCFTIELGCLLSLFVRWPQVIGSVMLAWSIITVLSAAVIV